MQCDSREITLEHLQIAIGRTLDESHESIRTSYHAATMSARVNLYREVLLACALAQLDEFGFFSASAVRGPLEKITKTQHRVSSFNKHLEKLCRSERGAILHRKGEARRYGYRFSDPLMQPFIVLRAYHDQMMPVDLMPSSASPYQGASSPRIQSNDDSDGSN